MSSKVLGVVGLVIVGVVTGGALALAAVLNAPSADDLAREAARPELQPLAAAFAAAVQPGGPGGSMVLFADVVGYPVERVCGVWPYRRVRDEAARYGFDPTAFPDIALDDGGVGLFIEGGGRVVYAEPWALDIAEKSTTVTCTGGPRPGIIFNAAGDGGEIVGCAGCAIPLAPAPIGLGTTLRPRP